MLNFIKILMKKSTYLVYLFSFFTFAINSQELDEDFLKSLPDDIRQDVLMKTEGQTEGKEKKYRPSQFSSKLEQQEELMSLKLRIESDLAELEKRLQSDSDLSKNTIDELKIFGSDFFSTYQTSFMPLNEPNPDSFYTLDTGDVLKIQFIGQKEFIDTFELGGDGSVNIPDLGKLVLAGLSLNDVSELIKNKVNEIFIGTEAFISLHELRDINVLISGNAANPGVYTLTGNSNILHAISIAGGINEYGSYREINLLRNNKLIETLDLYDLLINGKFNISKRLRSGDVIFVSAQKSIISINGAIKRPAKYELKDNENLDRVIFYANGIKQTADLQNISLERILDNKIKSIPIVSLSQFNSIKPIDGDHIYIRDFPYRSATVSGAVLKPGRYTMAPGETIYDLIAKAGGYSENAYPFGAIYENDDARIINIKAKEILYKEFLDNIIAMSQQNVGDRFDLTPILGLIQEIKNSESNGRIVVDLNNDEMKHVIRVSDGDSLNIPEQTNNVYVYGEVSSEGAVMFDENQNLNYFINKSGGFKQYADAESIYVLHPNGETQRYSTKRNIFESQPKSNVEIFPGSVIFVPKKLDDSVSRRLATQAYVSILGSLGIALASLSTINNN